MLYVTTRSNRDAFTAHRALCENRGPDGGLYVPFRMPEFSAEQIDGLAEKPFSACVAEMLNLLFNTRLDSWDVEFCVGRYPARLVSMSHRIIIGEAWHNPGSDFSWLVKKLVGRVRRQQESEETPGDWAVIGVRIAVLFGLFGELMKEGFVSREKPMDISVVSGDFSAPMAAWYARQWGLPIENIVCCCNENSTPWDLLHRGEMRTGLVAVKTSTPDADVTLPRDMERLIFACGGYGEAKRYLEVCRRGGMYCPGDPVRRNLREGMYVSVVGNKRMEATILNVFRTNSRILGPYAALAYCGLLDYRAKTGESRQALLLSEKSPVCDAETVAKAMGISATQLKDFINKA